METIDLLIWHEMIQAKSWEQYISEYIGKQIDRKKIYSIVAIIFAIAGGSTWGLWKALNIEWMTPVIFAIMGIAQVLSAIQKEVVIDINTLQSLHKLRGMYISYFSKVERLFLTIETNKLSIEEREDLYYSLRETTIPIEMLKDSINIKDFKKINKKITDRVEEYLESTHYLPSKDQSKGQKAYQ